MEQKKIIWIVAATGLFLCVVIGAAMILHSKPAKQEPPVATITPLMPKESGETSIAPVPKESASSVPNVQYTTPDIIPPSGTTTIDLNTLKTAPLSAQTNTSVSQTDKPQNTSEAPKAVSEKSMASPVATKTDKPPVTVTSKTTAQTAQKKAAPSVAPAAAESKQSAPALTPRYWAQVGSFSNKKRAEDARDILDQNKITCEIFTYKDAKGSTFYRVRVGPYTTSSEGEYWRSKILQIPEFKDTEIYVTNSSAPKKN